MDCDGACLLDTDGDGVCNQDEIAGCLLPGACNYNPDATDGGVVCDYTSCAGCTDPTADNYDVTATLPDGDCEYLGCTDAGGGQLLPRRQRG